MGFSLDELVASKGEERGQFLKSTTESTLVLERVRKQASKKTKGVEIVALEFYVAATKDPNADPVGTRVTELFKFDFDPQKSQTKINLLKTIFNALGTDASDLAKIFADAERGRGDLARGAQLKVVAWQSPDAKYLNKKWILIPTEDRKKLMADGRAILDAESPKKEEPPF